MAGGAASSCEGTNFRCRVERPESDLVLIKVYGDLDYVTSPVLSECLDEQLGSSPTGSRAEIDLSGTTFVGVRGVAAMVGAAARARTDHMKFRVTGCSPTVLRLLELTDNADILGAS